MGLTVCLLAALSRLSAPEGSASLRSELRRLRQAGDGGEDGASEGVGVGEEAGPGSRRSTEVPGGRSRVCRKPRPPSQCGIYCCGKR